MDQYNLNQRKTEVVEERRNCIRFEYDVQNPLGLYKYPGSERRDVPGSVCSPLPDDIVSK